MLQITSVTIYHVARKQKKATKYETNSKQNSILKYTVSSTTRGVAIAHNTTPKVVFDPSFGNDTFTIISDPMVTAESRVCVTGSVCSDALCPTTTVRKKYYTLKHGPQQTTKRSADSNGKFPLNSSGPSCSRSHSPDGFSAVTQMANSTIQPGTCFVTSSAGGNIITGVNSSTSTTLSRKYFKADTSSTKVDITCPLSVGVPKPSPAPTLESTHTSNSVSVNTIYSIGLKSRAVKRKADKVNDARQRGTYFNKITPEDDARKRHAGGSALLPVCSSDNSSDYPKFGQANPVMLRADASESRVASAGPDLNSLRPQSCVHNSSRQITTYNELHSRHYDNFLTFQTELDPSIATQETPADTSPFRENIYSPGPPMACSTPRPRPSQNASRSLNLDFGQLSPAGFTLKVSDYSFSDVESSEPGERSHTVDFTSNATDSPHFGHGSAEVNQVLLNRSMFSETGASTGLDPCGMDSPQKPESPVCSSSRSPTYKLCYDSPPTFQTGLDSDAPIFQIARVVHQRSDTMYSRTLFPGIRTNVVRLLHTENVAF